MRLSPARPDRSAHDQALADGLRPGCAAIALLFAVFTVWHAVDFPFGVARVMVPLALATAAFAGGAYLFLRARRPAPGRAHLLGGALAMAAFLNCLVQLVLTGDEHLTVNVTLLVVAVGVCLVDPLWVVGLAFAFAFAWLGAIAQYGSGGQFSRTLADLVIGLVVATMANVLRRRTLSRLLHAQAALRDLAERCELTGLLNRRGFLRAAEQQIEGERPLTLWFLDVDDLKPVNDRFGHDTGDVLLLSVATALADVFPDAVVARLSGDEFAVVEPASSAHEQSRQRLRLEHRLAEVADVMGLPVRVSTGTATSVPGQSLSDLLSAADAAMYVAKAARRTARSRAGDPSVVREQQHAKQDDAMPA